MLEIFNRFTVCSKLFCQVVIDSVINITAPEVVVFNYTLCQSEARGEEIARISPPLIRPSFLTCWK